MTTPTPIYEGFSVSHAQVLDGTETFLDALARTDTESWDVYGVSEASMEPDTDNFDNEGDDTIMSRWNWINLVEVSVQAGYMSFPLIATITGEQVQTTTDSTTSEVTDQRINLWSERAMNVKNRPMLIKMPAKDSDGNPCSLIAGLYKVSFSPIVFEGPSYKEGLRINYNGQGLLSDKDETGTLLTDTDETGQVIKRVGEMIAVLR